MIVAGTAAVNRAGEISNESRFLQLCRVGFIGRGVLFIIIGLLVFGTGRTEDLTGALDYLDRGLGRILLAAVCAGMAAYGLWRLSDAALGAEHPGTHRKALAKRAAAGVIGLIYLYLSYKALGILLAGDSAQTSPQQQADTVLDLPGGPAVLGMVAAGLAVAGLLQLRKSARCSFLYKLDGRVTGTIVEWLGRIGYAARGIIMLMVAVLIGRAAVDGRADEAGGMEQALDLLSGPVLYAVAGGLILFGLFSIIEGLFRHLREPDMSDVGQQVRESLGS